MKPSVSAEIEAHYFFMCSPAFLEEEIKGKWRLSAQGHFLIGPTHKCITRSQGKEARLLNFEKQ